MRIAIVLGCLTILIGCGGGDGGGSSDSTAESAETAWTSPSGILDATYGTSGIATTGSAFLNATFTASVLDAQGRLVAAGYASLEASSFAIVSRFDANGVLDPSFGGTGYVSQSIGTADAYSQAMAIQADGKIVVAGYCADSSGATRTFALRVQPEGVMDASFGTDGTVLLDTGSGAHVAALAIDPEGRILLGGDTGSEAFVVRLDAASGALDTFIEMPLGKVSSVSTRALSVQSDGKILLAGSVRVSAARTQIFVLRCDPATASLDPTFDEDGILFPQVGDSKDQARAMALDSSGRILVAGSTFDAVGEEILVLRLDGSGRQVEAFASVGLGRATGIALQPDGRIVVSGLIFGTDSDVFVARFLDDGSIDPEFGTAGEVTTAIGVKTDAAYSLALQTDGKILVAGSYESSYDGYFAGFAARYR